MDKALAQEIAQLVLQGMWASKMQLLLGLVIWGLVSGVCAFLGAYLAKLAEGRVADSRFQTLKQQLADTTHLVQEIQTNVAHGDWAEREWKALRGRKLEELMQEAILADLAIHDLHRRVISLTPDVTNDSTSLAKVRLLQAMFFPEMKQTVHEFWMAVATTDAALREVGISIFQAPDAQRKLEIAQAAGEALKAKRAEVAKARSVLEKDLNRFARAIYGLPEAPIAPEN